MVNSIDWRHRPPRQALIIKMRYIGDTVLVTPLLGAMKQALPATALHLLVNRQSAPIIQGHPHVDQLIAFDYERARRDLGYLFGFVRRLRRQGYDLVIDLTRNDRSALFAFASGAAWRIGYDGGSWLQRHAYTHRLPYRFGRTHTVDHHLEVATALGLPVADRHPFLPVADADRRWVEQLLAAHGLPVGAPFVLIHPGARRWYKSWPLERFSRIADGLIGRYGVPVALSGAPEDRDTCQTIAAGMAHRAVNLCGRVPLDRLPALIQASILLIGNDSAPIHVATAVNTPVVALFGPTRWEDWRPRRDHDQTLGVALACRPCGHSRSDCPLGGDYCLSHITEDRVWQAVAKRLAEVGMSVKTG